MCVCVNVMLHDDLNLNVSRETLALLERYRVELVRWNRHINLLGPQELDRFSERHLLDCLHLASLLPANESIVDLGSGGGLPGLVIAIVNQCPVTLIEADQRKAAFLRECGRELGLKTTVIARRIEALTDLRVGLIVARALAPLDRLLDFAAPLLTPDGRCLFIKGSNVDTELTKARLRWQMTAFRHPTMSVGDGCVLEVTNLRRAEWA